MIHFVNSPDVGKYCSITVFVVLMALLFPAQKVLAAATPNLDVGLMEFGEFGYMYDGTSSNLEQAQLTFTGSGNVLTLTVTGFDIDLTDEVVVRVNGVKIGALKVSGNQSSALTTLPINVENQRAGENTITFLQSSIGNHWGVTDIMLTEGCNYPLVLD